MTHVALLRAVNVGGHNKIAMPDLCRFFADQGFGGARSLLQSGNVVFDGGTRGTGRNWNTVLKLSALCK